MEAVPFEGKNGKTKSPKNERLAEGLLYAYKSETTQAFYI
jgi:hypothetical protein